MTNDPAPYWHPFHKISYNVDENLVEGKEHPRTVLELHMNALSNVIREKPEWWIKMKNPELASKWRAEVHDQQSQVAENEKLNDGMIDYIFSELEGYAALRDPSTGIQPGPFDRIWRSDELVPAELRSRLLEAIVPLEHMPPDWHPGSNDQVLDLVHPSLYPVVYGRTLRSSGALEPPKSIDPPRGNSYSISKNFQWLPSDFAISDSGEVTLTSPYINNVHEIQHAKLYNVLPKILQCAVPMFERVLSDLRRRLLPTRLQSTYGLGPDCLWRDLDEIPQPDEEEEPEEYAEYIDDSDIWFAKQPMNLPEARPRYEGDLDAVKKTVSLNGTTVQCIVKLANIVLTPEKPKYPGGSWHVEGDVERAHSCELYLCKSFLCYYDTENINISRLAFRRSTCPPMHHLQNDGYCMSYLYNITRDDICIQEVGEVTTSNGMSIAFPNIYQHKVAPFELEDPSKPGHRKILVFFLVDPTMRIPSASDVLPQQREYVQEVTRSIGPNSLFGNLPLELVEMIEDYVDSTMTREEAEDYRILLMNERTIFVDESTSQYFGQMFNMCEH